MYLNNLLICNDYVVFMILFENEKTKNRIYSLDGKGKGKEWNCIEKLEWTIDIWKTAYNRAQVFLPV